MQRDKRKRMSTMTAPRTIPITTQRCRPKIEVLFDSCVFRNAASNTDIFESSVGVVREVEEPTCELKLERLERLDAGAGKLISESLPPVKFIRRRAGLCVCERERED